MNQEALLHSLGWHHLEPELTTSPEEKQALAELVWQRLTQHGDFSRWEEALKQLDAVLQLLPHHHSLTNELNRAAPQVGALGPHSAAVESSLRQLGPWKKGPFSLHGVELDAEWRSCLKWERLTKLASAWEGRRVLDVGCGNGYFLLRILGQGARLALGLDPSVLFTMQYRALARCFSLYDSSGSPSSLTKSSALSFLPLTLEQWEPQQLSFDTVLSMGVLYHRRSPLDHLLQLKSCLRPGGELLLETLVIEGPTGMTLLPSDRYAGMRNVWFLPSPATLESWLLRAGFQSLDFSPLAPTTEEEQRSTTWASGPSLSDFLDPHDPTRTREGHPAPQRLLVRAHNP